MEYRSVKNTDLHLSVIGTGCWAFGGGEYWGPQNQKDVNEVVRASVDNGINYFDTAEVYNEGRSEASLGLAIKGITRDKLIIGTKVSPSNAFAGTLEKHCEESLRRLQTSYIDIYMIHWPIHPHSIRHFTSDESIINHPPDIYETVDSLQKLQKAGKVRYIGVSNFSSRCMKEDIPENSGLVVNELPYNLLSRAIEFDTLPYCIEHGIGTIGYMTLLQGILTGKYASLKDVPAWQRRTRHFNSADNPLCRHGEGGFEEETRAALIKIDSIARQSGMTMSELAIKWPIASGLTCALVGARNVVQLDENVRAADGRLEFPIVQMLDQATNKLKELLENHFDYYESRENDRTW